MADQHASDLPAITLPIVDTDVVIMSRDGTQLHDVPVSDLLAYFDANSGGADSASNIAYDPVTGRVTQVTNITTGEVTNFIYTNGVLTSLTVTLGASVKTQTFTYTNGVLTAVSALA